MPRKQHVLLCVPTEYQTLSAFATCLIFRSGSPMPPVYPLNWPWGSQWRHTWPGPKAIVVKPMGGSALPCSPGLLEGFSARSHRLMRGPNHLDRPSLQSILMSQLPFQYGFAMQADDPSLPLFVWRYPQPRAPAGVCALQKMMQI